MTIRLELSDTLTGLRDLVARVQVGDEVEIAEGGRVLAKLISFEDAARRRGFGMLKGRVWMADDFDAPLSDEELTLNAIRNDDLTQKLQPPRPRMRRIRGGHVVPAADMARQ